MSDAAEPAVTGRASSAELPPIGHRLALASLVFAVAGPVTYALLRGWVYLRGGGGGILLLLRQQTVGYFQALAVSAFVGVALAASSLALARHPDELGRLERALQLAMVPALLASGLGYFLLP